MRSWGIKALLAVTMLGPGALACADDPDDDGGEATEDELNAGGRITTRRAATVDQVKRPPLERDRYRVHMIDVGTGLSILVQGSDFNALFDGGSNDDRGRLASKAGNRNRLLAYLYAAVGPSGPKECVPLGDKWPEVPSKKLPLKHLFLSHPHLDHVSMLDDVLRCYDVENVWEPGAANDTDAYGEFVQVIGETPGVTYRTSAEPNKDKKVVVDGRALAIQGKWEHFRPGRQSITAGRGASFKILHANAGKFQDENMNSLVVAFKLGPAKLLLMGDAESGERQDPSAPVGHIEKFLLEAHPKEVKADIFQVAHHGSKTSNRKQFLDAVSPRFALVSSGPTKYAGVQLPDREVIDALKGLKPKPTVLRTDEHDARCPEPDRIGLDDDAPGGCDNVILEISTRR
jgi:competence protein ComEC